MSIIEQSSIHPAIPTMDYLQLERLARRSETIARASATLAQAQDDQSILRAAAMATDDCPADLYSLGYIDNSRREVTTMAVQTKDGNPLPLSALPTVTHAWDAHPIIGLLMKTPNILIAIEDTETYPHFTAEIRHITRAMGMNAVIGVALQTGTEVQSILIFMWQTPQHFTPDLTETLTGLIPVAAAVVNNRRNVLKLQQSEARYRTLASNLPKTAIALYDHDLRFLLVEGEEATNVGLPKSLLEGKRLHEAFPPELAAKNEPHFRAALAGDTITFESVINDQRLRVTHLPVKDEQGKVINAVALVVNITEQKLAEEALRKNEELLTLVVRDAPLTLYSLDENGIFTLSEGKSLEALGLRPGQLVGANVLDAYGDSPEIVAHLKRSLAGEITQYETKLGDYWFDVIHTPVFDASGKVTRVNGFSVDITERKKAEAQVAASAKRTRDILDNLAVFAVLMDRDGNMLEVNSPIYAATDLKPEDLIGRSYVDAGWFNHERKAVMQRISADQISQAQQGKSVTVEVESVIAKGQRLNVLVTMGPVYNENGEVVNLVASGVDITERKKAETALRENEALLRSVVDNLPQSGVAIIDRNSRFEFVGGPEVANIGLSPALIGKTLEEVLGAEMAMPYKAVLQRAFDENGMVTELTYADNTFINSYVPLKNAAGETTRMLSLSQNITERKKAESALRENEALLRSVVDNLPNAGVAILDRDYRFQLIGGPEVTRIGLAPELVGKTIVDILGDVAAAPYTAILQQAFDAEGLATEFTYGDQTFASNYLPLKNAQGEITRLLNVAQNITERLQAETALRQSEEQYRAIFEATSDGMIINDLETGAVIDVNPAVLKMHGGYTREEFLGLRQEHFIAPEDMHKFDYFMQAMQAGKIPFVQARDKRKDGSMFNIEITGTQFFHQGKRRILSVLRDISDRVAAEAQREQLIKDLQAATRLAQENSRLKSEFLSTMSHELRTPLNAIEGFTGIVLTKMGGAEFNEKTERYLTRVHANSRRLLQLINDFLDLSRIESGRLQLANQPFSPIKLARRWQDEIGVLADKKGLALTVNLPSDMPETLIGDEEAISKVAINLLGNAIKFTEQGGVTLSLQSNGDSWDIVVADTGIGIPPHARDFIFEEFRQVDQTSKRKYGGTGLGLAIVQKYTRAMGGTVALVSEQGQGSKFTITLPAKTSN
jgi:PAS domain S-box-containing protein